jgi:hypothetical protein
MHSCHWVTFIEHLYRVSFSCNSQLFWNFVWCNSPLFSDRPDDIHTMYSGKTVEINNTDAEGRLVLGGVGRVLYRYVQTAT